MKTLFSKVNAFFKREWFLLIMVATIAIIIVLAGLL